ncbi:3'(2'),5'-bisphosphate nucleotidase CysQ [Aeromicrobium sp. 9AM]|uniref:3'(2'),5'-bisphosphate nucleotidase CysQ n=1 Tax=Aeromicrobium sp. 9AM TaxID=2653126 RepID=UPI0012F3FF16|nr:3'(2'),5'-bisphosphate nucleotidase CysQ [Aeromicrobium sp. 9AM]VXC26967.1 3'-phosphoadenosine 5'-phosphate phosphatase [Aeromicrobium sp. 9AM]
MTEQERDAALAAELAERAGALLLDLKRTSGLTGKELGKAGDEKSNELLLALLAERRPGDAVLSEESADSPERLTADRVWIIDPLDGTREYGMADRSDWAVHVALWERGAPGSAITAAAVAQPALSMVYSTTRSSVVRGPHSDPIFLVSDSRPPVFAAEVAEALDAELRPMGSAGAKAMAVLRGDADAYLHAGGQWEWDSAAPVGVALAAGLHASRVDGSTLTYNAEHPYLPDLVICRADLADKVLTAIAAAS